MTFYYKLQYSDYMIEDITDEVIFLGDRFTLKELEVAADTLTARCHDKVRDPHDIKALISFIVDNDHHYIIDEVIEGYKWLANDILADCCLEDGSVDWPDGFYNFTIISQLLQLLDEDYLIAALEGVTDEILDLIADDMDILKDYLASLGYIFGSVGYSNWSYYLAAYDDESYYHDLWEGINFYDIFEYNDKGELVDSVGSCYIKSDEDLANYISLYFQDEPEDIKLIESEFTSFTDYQVYKMIPTEYEFIKN